MRLVRTCVWALGTIFLSVVIPAVKAGVEYPAKTGEEVISNQLLIKLRPGTLPSAIISSFLQNAQIQTLNLSHLYIVNVPGGIPPGISALLASHPLVDFVEPNRVRKTVLAAPNDPNYSSALQWGLFTVQALQAWSQLPGQYLTSTTAGVARVKVAVLDTGADCTHPDFINTGGNSTDSAAGGQLLWSASQAFVPTTHLLPACTWQDDNGHGTHVSGIVAAATSNNTGVAGLGYPLQVIEFKVLDASGTGSDSVIANAIVAATNAGARVISMSFGAFGYSQTLQTAINYAWQNNVVVVAAAGNSASSSLFFPAGANHAIAVSASDGNNNLAGFSNFGNAIGVGAPGVSILSTIPAYTVTLGCCNYGSFSGTSMATPFVSALAGLVAMTTPSAAAPAILRRIEQTAASNTIGGGWGQSFGYGIINAYNAIAGAIRPASTGGVVGQVIDTFGNAVGSAQITIGGQISSTDSSGLYWIRSLAPGSYPASISAPGYSSQSLSVNVTAGADTPFTITMGITYGSFNGTVTDQGAPVSGAIVQALSGGLVVGTAVTGSNGQYSLWVPAGSGYVVQTSQIGRNTNAVSSLTVAAGNTTTVNISLPLFGTIAGVVRDANLNPIAGAQIIASTSTFSAGAVTNANGTYLTSGLPSGTYSVTASSASFSSGSTQTGVVSVDATTTLNFQLGSASPNLALGKTTTQSSSYGGVPNSARAVDGNTDGNFGDASVTHTNFETSPWWQVDLGFSATVNSVVIWNRTDCCGDRLSDYWIFISNTPFAPTDTPATLQNRAGTWSSHQTVAPNPSVSVSVPGAQGQYVRVQLSNANFLSLAEVQVLGSVGGTSSPDLAIAKSHTNSFTQGQTGATYTITVSNIGSSATTGTVTVTDILPAGLTATAISGTGWSCTSPAGPCTRSDALASGSSYPPITLTVNVAGNAPAGVTNTATVSGGGEINTGNDTATDPTTITPAGGSSNLALGKSATQSSSYGGVPNAARAVDGNTDGNFSNGSVTHSDFETNPWWQVNLGASATVNSVVVWNRTDCCGSRLSDYWIFISNTPFAPTDTPATLQNRAGTWSSHQTVAPNPSVSVSVPGAQGQYVRVQLGSPNFLSLAEVQVLGSVGGTPSPDLTISESHTNSFTQGQTGASYAITVSNIGSGATTSTVTVTDILPAGLTATAISGTGWSCTSPAGPCTRSDALAPGSSYPPITLTVNVAGNAPASVTNTATVSGGGETNAGNDTATDPTTITPAGGSSNLALGKSASQSTSYGGVPSAGRAVDGNTDGNFSNGSVTHSDFETNPWWQVNLGASATVNSVVVWNRTDCCGSRLSDYWIFISNTPFAPTDTPATLQNRAGTWSSHQTVAPNPNTTVAVPGAQGQYVRVQLGSPNFLSLAEVQVMGF